MMDQAACDDIRDRSLIERYVAGKLTEAEAAELEAHYLTCARCQGDVRLAAAIRGAPVERSRRPVAVWGGLGLAVAAGLAAILLLAPHRPAPELVRLGDVLEPPVYLGIPVRAAPARGDSIFEAAMAAYAARQYDAAAAGLGAALAAGVDSVPAEFFRAASLLMTKRNEDAAAGFTRVIALGESPYLPESRYYLAKALLRRGLAREAVRRLHEIGVANRELHILATALADSIEAIAR
jgi:anti-sigma factor RsiW